MLWEMWKKGIVIDYHVVFCCLNGFKMTEKLKLIEEFLTNNNIMLGSTLEIDDNADSVEKDRNDMIELTKLVVFLLNEDYLKSNQFSKDLEFVQKIKKPVIFLLIEPIDSNKIAENKINLDQLNVIELYKSDETNLFKGEMFYRFMYLIYSFLQKQDLIHYENGIVCINDINKIKKPKSLPFEKLAVKKRIITKFVEFVFYFKEKNHLLVIVPSNQNNKLLLCIHCPNKNFDLIGFIRLDIPQCSNICMYFNTFCDKLCIASDNQVYYYNYNNNYEFETTSPLKITKRYLECVHAAINDNVFVYYKRENVIHAYDKTLTFMKEVAINNYLKDFNYCKVCCLQVLSNNLYVFMERQILIFDLNMNYVTKIVKSMIGRGFKLIEDLRTENTLYFCFFENGVKKLNPRFQVFNGNGYKFYNVGIPKQSLMGHDINKTSIINNYLLLSHLNYLEIFEINSISAIPTLKSLSNQYYCKINTPKPHLLVNPYKLPCGNLACLTCIYDNYNLYTNKFVCCTETCKDEHFLNHQMEPSSIIKDNLIKICEAQIRNYDDMKDISKRKDETRESLTLIFDYIYNELQIRVESLKSKIDEQYTTAINNIDQVKHSFLELTRKRINKPKRKKIKMDISEKIDKFNKTLSSSLTNYPFRMFDEINEKKIGKFELAFLNLNYDTVSSDSESSEDSMDDSS